MSQPVWLLKDAVIALHKYLVAEHGGVADVRDKGLLESALARPENKHAYEPGATIHGLAAAYAFCLARNHPFVDGDKRIAFTAIAMFLGPNGYKFAPEPVEAYNVIIALAAGDISEEDLARWIAANSSPV